MEGIGYLVACCVVLFFLVLVNYRYVPIISRIVHRRAHVNVAANGEVVRVSGGGYELKSILALAHFIANFASGFSFTVLSGDGVVDLLLLDKEESKRKEFINLLKDKMPSVVWTEVEKDRVRRRLWSGLNGLIKG